MEKEYVSIDSRKLAGIKHEALQKLAANKERPLSEASIEARAVIQVINAIYELNERVELDRENYHLKSIVDFYKDLVETGNGCGREGCKVTSPHVH